MTLKATNNTIWVNEFKNRLSNVNHVSYSQSYAKRRRDQNIQ